MAGYSKRASRYDREHSMNILWAFGGIYLEEYLVGIWRAEAMAQHQPGSTLMSCKVQ